MQQKNESTNSSSSNSLSSSFRALTSGGSLTWKTTFKKGDSSNDARHCTDYKILKELGRGGFGKVYLVEHKLDGKLYAMKVVAAPRSDMDFNKVLREVQVLSSIQNEHVVRYYSAWVEKTTNTNNGHHLLTTSSSTTTTTSASFGDVVDTSYNTTTTTANDVVSNEEDPICNLCHSNYKDWEVSFESWGLIDAVLQPLDLCVECYTKNLPDDIDTTTITIRLQQSRGALRNFLYIVMEYCECTLTDVISASTNNGNSSTTTEGEDDDNDEDGVSNNNDEKKLWSLFGQILEGFTHLHANGVIHRDIKPSNIFVQKHNHNNNNVVKIGDLGLAITHNNTSINSNVSAVTATAAATTNTTNTTTTATSATFVSSTSTSSLNEATKSKSKKKKSSNVGTFLYTAPEIQSSKYYDEKADIYSLGILLLEIFYKFNTGMERVKVISDIRENMIFPDDFITKYPIQYELAKRMLNTNPKLRPSCLDILQELEQKHGLYYYYSSTTKTSNLVEHLQSRIVSLQDTIRQQDEELNRLKQLLTNHNISF